MKVLVVGSGGREHCLTWKLAQSLKLEKIYCAPGNGGTAKIAENLNIEASDILNLVKFAKSNEIDLTVVGPEAPLVEGIVDTFEREGLKVFGPSKELANLEGSKIFAKKMMKKYGVPTADFKVFTEADLAKEYLKETGAPIVVKADGLAAGKGVIVASTLEEAEEAVDLMLVDKVFGEAGEQIIIEDCLKGEEASILVFTDGQTILPMVSSQDHKRALDDDKGPNTGGMGAYAPAPLVDDELFKRIEKEICEPLIHGLAKDGKKYKGILYVGLMIDKGNPQVLEFNVRFGDPETQVVLPKLKNDLVDIMVKTADENLNDQKLEWDERCCISVVLASGGYPGKYEKGKVITGLDSLDDAKDIYVFHAGTKLQGDKCLTSGGRVLNIVGLADSLPQAQEKVYSAIEKVNFEGMHYRKDIGNKALSRL